MVLVLLHGLADVVYGCQQLVTLQKESLWLCSRVQVTEVTVNSVFQKPSYALLRAAHCFSP